MLQQVDGVAPATINPGLSTLRRLCTWAIEQKRLAENPTKDLTDIPSTPVSPRSLPDQAGDALLRAVRSEPDLRLRLRDETLLALLVYAGLRVQEVCDVQLQNLDLASGTLVVRSGKGGKPRLLPLHSEAQRTLTRYLQRIRCPAGMPPIGGMQERETLLVGMRRASAQKIITHIRPQAEQQVFAAITRQITITQAQALEELLQREQGKRGSTLAWLKEPAVKASPPAIKVLTEQARRDPARYD